MATAAHGDGHGVVDPAHGIFETEHIHHPTLDVYVKTFLALMVLLILTVVMYYVDLSKWVPIPGINLIIALIIASVKATLVVLYFMNVKGSTRLTWLWAALGFVWLLLMAGVFLDYQSRAWMEAPGWESR